MKYTEKTKEVIKLYNEKKGNISKLVKDVGISRAAFYSNLNKLGIIKDEEKDLYIIPDDNIKGQINLLDEPEKEIHKIPELFEPVKQRKEVEKVEKREVKPIDPLEKKKKTFEIDVKLEKYIRVQAAKENITINEWVNKTLWAAIPDDTKEFIKS